MWAGSPFGWIKTRPSRQVGAIGEKLVRHWCTASIQGFYSALQSVFDIHQTGHGNALSVGGYPILTGHGNALSVGGYPILTGHGNALSVGGYPILTGLTGLTEMKKSQQ